MRADAVSTLLLPLLALLTLSVGADPTHTLSTLRVHTFAPWGETANTVELTLWYNGLIYECEVEPAKADTDYECSSFEISQSNLLLGDDQNGLLRVTNDHKDAVMFSLIEMTTAGGDSYGITGICIGDDATIGAHYARNAKDGGVCPSGSTHYDYLGVDDQESEYSPPTQFVYFNLELPNQSVDDAQWSATLHDCADFDIDGVLNQCSADFPAEKEALKAATARVTQLESDTATTDAAVEALSADLLTLQSEAAATSASLAATDATVESLSAHLSTLKAAWQTFESAHAGPGIDIGAEDELEQAAHVSVFALSASSPLMIGAMALLAVLLAVNLCFAMRSCSARAKGKYAAVAAVDSVDSEEISPIRV